MYDLLFCDADVDTDPNVDVVGVDADPNVDVVVDFDSVGFCPV